jgi:hypothetical protein
MHSSLQARLWTLPLWISLLLLFLNGQALHAQAVSEYQVKAAYVYNFAKFVEWPAQDFASSTAPIHLCVFDDQAFQSELNRLVTGKTVSGHPIVVIAVPGGDQPSRCHVLFVNSSQDRKARSFLKALRDKSVLTIGEGQGFVEDGGIIGFVMRDDRVQFEVNHKAANHAGLHISSRLLSIASAVIE